MPPFLNYLQEIYNSLAVLNCEYENNTAALGFAEKAEEVYHMIKKSGLSDNRYGSNLNRHLKA